MAKNVKCKRCFHLYNDWCIPKHDSPDPDIVRDCLHFIEKTNADRLRAMSDEELAEFIGGIYTLERDAWGDYDPCVVVESVKIRDKEDMLSWLQSSVNGGDHDA